MSEAGEIRGDLVTWRQLLTTAMSDAADDGPVIAYAPNDAAFDTQFDNGYGLPHGPAVLAWTETRVYFSVVYDGAEWLASASRHPTWVGQEHVGGC